MKFKNLFPIAGFSFLLATCPILSAHDNRYAPCFASDTKLPEYIQIREMMFAAGIENFNAWRIYPDDLVETAAWNNNGKLLKRSYASVEASGLFARAMRLEGDLAKLPDDADDGALGRLAYTITLTSTLSEHTRTNLITNVPDSITRLVNELKSLPIVFAPNISGKYIWVEPSGRPAIDAVNLNKSNLCDKPELSTIAKAISTGSLVEKLSGDDVSIDSAPGQVFAVKARFGWYLFTYLH